MDDLGPVVLSCRARRPIDVWKDFGEEPFAACLRFSVAGAIYLTVPIMGLSVWSRLPEPMIDHPIWWPILGVWFIACAGILCRYCLSVPGGETLVLHADGFRQRRKSVRFEDVASLRVGHVETRPMQFLHNVNEVFGTFRRANRRAAEQRKISRRASVMVGLKDGRTWTMRGVLLAYEKEDIERFFAAIAERHPELTLIPWEEPAPEVDDLPELHDPALEGVRDPAPDPIQSSPSRRSLIVFLVIVILFVLFSLDQFGLSEWMRSQRHRAVHGTKTVIKKKDGL